MTAALILAGGQGTRLGGVDKAFLRLRGRPLIEHLLDRLAPQAQPLAISANGDPARFSAYGLPVLPDGDFSGRGPLAGIAAGLAWAAAQGAASLVSVPVDTPFIPADLVPRLSPAPRVAACQGRQHHLVAHWRVSDLAALRRFLETAAPYKVRDFLQLCGAAQVDFPAPADPFLNINAPEDLKAASFRLNRR